MAKKKKKLRGKPWTKEEIKKLRKIFRNMTNKEVAKAMGRGVDPVRIKGNRLGLKKTKKHLRSIGRKV